MINSQLNKNFVAETALDFVLRHADTITYPLRPEVFFGGGPYNAWLLPWTEACRAYGTADFFNLKKHGADAATDMVEGDSGEPVYLTVYDDTVKSMARQSFTKMHELGHVLLGHMDECRDSGGKISYAFRGQLEREADSFAAETLSPAPLIMLLGLKTPEEVARVFRVSRAAAVNRLRDVERNGNSRLYRDYMGRMERAFRGF